MFNRNYQFYVNIISNMMNGTLFLGMTNDLERRTYEHKNGLVEGFSKRNRLKKLMYFEQYKYVNDTIKREKQLKNWKQQWKIDLIEEENNKWNDLAFDWLV